MNFAEREAFYRQIEEERDTKVIAYVTGDRRNMETQIGADCIDIFIEKLDEIGPTKKISLVLHTNGGNTAAAWRLVNLIKSFCDEFEVIIPFTAMSAGTLISLGAHNIVMTKQATLGPIDPSLNHPLGPSVKDGNQLARLSVSVEAVRGYLDAACLDLGIKDDSSLATILTDLSNKVHPLVLGEIFRSRAQIRFLAEKLLNSTMKDGEKIKPIVDFLCADSGSHDYTINRREAKTLGLPVEKPTNEFYALLKSIQRSYSAEMKLAEPFNPLTLATAANGAPVQYKFVRAVIESVDNGSHAFISEGVMTRQVGPQQGPMPPQQTIQDQRQFEGWRQI
ncbi:SDH family Clp fold serine proteinase [Martelella endophytica]|uniref:Serine protease n=1 Tax=Martelella endophytica TaxID=1486262 RepID=A0A0D5LMW4_MAREN|nr:hypothetical protein [Martelella endophytica]AJY44653.1 hypothetical protein TM49_01480 [Martelella endophytica]